MEVRDALNSLRTICTNAGPTPTQSWAKIVAAREQMMLLWPAAVRGLVAHVCSRAIDIPLTNFLIDNNFVQLDGFDNTSAENPILAPIYNTSTIAPSESMMAKLGFYFATRLPQLLTASAASVQEMFLNRITQFLPDTPEGAAIFKKALDAAPAGANHMLLVHIQNIPPLGWKEHLAEVLFNHPSMVPFFYKTYGADYEARAAPVINFSHYAAEALKKWREVDRRLVQVRKARAAAQWRRVFWAAVVFQWRKREFLERYYAPGGAGTDAAAKRFYDAAVMPEELSSFAKGFLQEV
jgi:hypothetical protein